MAKIKLTKNELKKQKDSLKRFERYLPTLVLKKQQLQTVIRQVESAARQKMEERAGLRRQLDSWIAVFGEDVAIEKLVHIDSLKTSEGNIAGVDIPVFEGVSVSISSYDLEQMPLWVDTAVRFIQQIVAHDAEIQVLREQRRLLSEELRVTTQRVNLFEKVKIPETRENIRRIGIYLGDEQTAAVVRGKIAKKNLVREV